MSAEAIAKVIRDFKLGRAKVTVEGVDPIHQLNLNSKAMSYLISEGAQATVDVTAVYKDFTHGDVAWRPYEDSIVRPPFDAANYAYLNQHGNVIVMACWTNPKENWIKAPPAWGDAMWKSMSGTHEIDWNEVAWVTQVHFYIGGRSIHENAHIPTQGPMYFVEMAIYPDGTMADLHWRENHDKLNTDHWTTATVILLKALTVLNCRNVEVMEPVSRPKAERKRIARTGVTVSEIHITPMGKYRRTGARPVRYGEGVPLGVVRGHVARYGDKYGRGKLFGKYEGEFWIPGHLRGTADLGEVEHEYIVEAQ